MSKKQISSLNLKQRYQDILSGKSKETFDELLASIHTSLRALGVGDLEITVISENQNRSADFRQSHVHVYIRINNKNYEEFILTEEGYFVSQHKKSEVYNKVFSNVSRKDERACYGVLNKYALLFHWLWRYRNQTTVDVVISKSSSLNDKISTEGIVYEEVVKKRQISSLVNTYNECLYFLIDIGEIDPDNPFPNITKGKFP